MLIQFYRNLGKSSIDLTFLRVPESFYTVFSMLFANSPKYSDSLLAV
jgi:hypothetical protein